MPRALLLCTTIVAAFQLQPAAASTPVSDAPVPPAVVAVGVRLGVDAAQEPARFIPEITRLLYTPLVGRQPAIELLRERGDRSATASSSSSPLVPVPLTAEVWGRAVF